MTLRAREAVTATVLAAVSLWVAVALVAVQLIARGAPATVRLLDGVGVAVARCAGVLDIAGPFMVGAIESCAAGADQFITQLANWTAIGVERLAGLVLLLPLSVGQLVTALGVGLPGPAAITLLLIAGMFSVRLFAPRVCEFLNDVLSVPLAVGGIAYAIMRAKRR